MIVRILAFILVIIVFGIYVFILIHDLHRNRKKIDKSKPRKNKKQKML
jgi:hypothetical protein